MKSLLRIRILLLPLLTALVLASCAHSADEPAPAPEEGMRMSLIIDVNESMKLSRTPAGDYDHGIGFENYIGIKEGDFKIYLLDEQANTLISQINDASLTVETTAAPYKRYRLQFSVGQRLYDRLNGKSAKLMMLANWGSYPGVAANMPLADIVGHSLAVKAFTPFGADVTEDRRIPMFGICRYDSIQLAPDATFDLGTLHMLRAYAKTEVIDAGDHKTDTFKIAKVELLRYNDKAAKAPYGVADESDYKKDNWELDYGPAPSIPASARVVDAAAPFDSVSEKSHVIYCPEYKNEGKNEDQASRIRVTYSDGQEYYIDYKDYATDKPFDIRRNYYYRYTVSRKGQAISLEVDVYPYIPVDLRPSFGIDPDVPQP